MFIFKIIYIYLSVYCTNLECVQYASFIQEANDKYAIIWCIYITINIIILQLNTNYVSSQ